MAYFLFLLEKNVGPIYNIVLKTWSVRKRGRPCKELPCTVFHKFVRLLVKLLCFKGLVQLFLTSLSKINRFRVLLSAQTLL